MISMLTCGASYLIYHIIPLTLFTVTHGRQSGSQFAVSSCYDNGSAIKKVKPNDILSSLKTVNLLRPSSDAELFMSRT